VHQNAPKCTIAAERLSEIWRPDLDLDETISIQRCTHYPARAARRSVTRHAKTNPIEANEMLSKTFALHSDHSF